MLLPPEAGLVSTTDPWSQAVVAAIVAGVFVLLALEKVHRVLVVLGAVCLIWAISYLTPLHLISLEGAQRALDFNVLLLLASMMAVIGVLKSTGVFEWAVARLLNRAGGNPWLIVALLTWFTAILSALCDNVTTVIFVTPMALQIAEAVELNPMALLLPVVMASNIGGTGTLIGDPPNIMIGSGAGLSFLDFVINVSAPVGLMMLLLPWASGRYFRRDYEAAGGRAAGGVVPVPAIIDRTLLRWSLWIGGAILVGFFTHGLTGMPSAVPATIGAGALLTVQDILYLRRRDPTNEERVHGVLGIIEREIEWPTLAFFAFLFIAVGAAVETGLIDTMARGLAALIRGGSARFHLSAPGTLLFASILVIWVSGIVSALVDNIPFVAVMIPIIHRLSGQLTGDTTVLWWSLALGACLGGNGSLVGASANVTVVGIAERSGVRISFGQFTRFGALIAAGTLVVSSAFVASHVYLGAHLTSIVWGAAFFVALIGRGALRMARSSRVVAAAPRRP